jgi:hypothetical protein
MERQKSYISFAGACFAMFVFILWILLSGCTTVPIEREKIVEQWCAQPENDCFTPDTLPTGRTLSTQVEIDALLKDFCEQYPDKCVEKKLGIPIQLLPPDPEPDQVNDHPEDLLGGFRHGPDDDAGEPGKGEPAPDIMPDRDPPDISVPGSPSPPGPDKDPGCDRGDRSDHGKGDHSVGKGHGHDRGNHDGRGSKGDKGDKDSNGRGHGRGGGNSGNGRGNGDGR